MPTKNRIFWNEQEKQAVVTAARTLRSKSPDMNLEDVAAKAQASLPKNRRRPMNGKLISWVSKSIRGVAGAASGSAPAGAGGRTGQRRGRPPAQQSTTQSSSATTQAVIDAGAQILSGIITHPSVRAAIVSAFGGSGATQGRAGK